MAGTHVGAAVAAVDPTKQPAPGSFWVFVFMAVMLVLLILSMLRHLRRADANLRPAEAPAPTPGAADPVDREDDLS